MDISCGTDIIEISRIKEVISNDASNKFKKRIYTEIEIEYCEAKNEQKYQHYAARFAAKEAVLKAISKKLNSKFEIEWKQIEIVNSKEGRPEVHLNNKVVEKISSIDLSMSHCKEYATATAIAVFIL